MKSLAPKSSLEDLHVDRLLRTLLSDDWIFKTGVGGMLVAGSIVAGLYSYMCIPIVVALWALIIGYSLRCMRYKMMNPDCKLPDWGDWGDLFLSGITWVALQTFLWVMIAGIAFGIMILCSAYAIGTKNPVESNIDVILGCLLIGFIYFMFSVLSAYLMVNFAQEENTGAGMAFRKVARRILAEPLKYLSAYFLAVGIQWASFIVPCITIVGVFLLPSAFFIGQAASAAVLGRAWASTASTENEGDKKKLDKAS
ncbi:MAG: DUF4013 domain-containing protein [Candidatus Obscuribacterales bacterium]|jgi:hypothetical protein|nr:DUF4013 domain-containing protein [Candidatus Obscuribacterales bacterium]